MSNETPAAVEARALWKSFMGGDGHELAVLEGVELRVEAGKVVAVVGSSGAGKSTLLHLLGALDRPNSGEVLIGGQLVVANEGPAAKMQRGNGLKTPNRDQVLDRVGWAAVGLIPGVKTVVRVASAIVTNRENRENEVSGVDAEALARIRNETVGFVFQFHHLLREFTALENVMMPCLIAGVDRRTATEKARGLLAVVGLEGRVEHRPAQLSGGEQQRVAVARALSNDPLVLLADEPSGNLDTHTSEELHDLLFRLREDRGLAMVLVTHNRELAGRADRIMELRDARLHEAV